MAGDDEYPLRTIYFYLTPECNLACRHCWIAPRFRNARTASEYLPLHLFQTVVEQAIPLGMTGIKLTGGEPFLHPDILDILQIAREHDLDVTVETNGTLITPELAESLVTCKNLFVSVSLDGADADMHEWVRGVRGSFNAVMEGVRTLITTGIRPQVIMSLFNRNVGQIADLVAMVEEMGVDSVKFNIIQPSARGTRVYDDGEGLDIEEVIRVSDWVVNNLSRRSEIPLIFDIPPVFKPLGSLFGEGGGGCGQCGIRGIIGVLGDGSYALCGVGETSPEMVFGHAATDPLEKVWRRNPVLREVREGLPQRLNGVCRTCAMKGVCLGKCLAQNYSQNRDLWSPFWFCNRMNEKGLFPMTRVINHETEDFVRRPDTGV